MGKFLRIFFGCHARPDRSFYWHGRQFPICARCTGELAGILIGIPAILLLGRLSVPVMILFMLPMLIDGFVQLLTKYTSTNLRRVVTGFLNAKYRHNLTSLRRSGKVFVFGKNSILCPFALPCGKTYGHLICISYMKKYLRFLTPFNTVFRVLDGK